ncbi:MAG: hypothetical protein ABR509_02505 [Candidatus Limnocylindria bacterium]
MIDLGAAIGGVAVILAAWLAYTLGRGAARQDRLRLHELDSIGDTRDRLLDVARLAEALADLEAQAVIEFRDALRSLRYARARNLLIANDQLIELLAATLPELLRTFPNTSKDLRSDLARLGNAIREAMYDQETSVLRTGKPLRQTKEQERRVEEMMEQIRVHEERFVGWSRVRIALTVWRRLTFGFMIS